MFAGKPAFARDKEGYGAGEIRRSPAKAHRVVWTLRHGYWPLGDIDHIDGDRRNNRLDNLRLVTHQQNGWNIAATPNMGAYFDKRRGTWFTSMRVNGQNRYFGPYQTQAEAAAKYRALTLEHRRDFADRTKFAS